MEKQKRTYYTQKDLVSFGNFVLSDARHEALSRIRKEQETTNNSPLNTVFDSDVANWRFIRDKK